LTNGGRRPVIAIAGNHDSPDRIEAPDPLARECGIIFAGYPNTLVPLFELETGVKITNIEEGFIELMIPGKDFPVRIMLTPYANEFRLKQFLNAEDSDSELRKVLQNHWQNLADKYCDNKGVNILISHLFMIKKVSLCLRNLRMKNLYCMLVELKQYLLKISLNRFNIQH
jgi:exonuclease SbcD